MKKVLISLLVLSVLCVAVVPLFSISTSASAEELVGQQYGMFSLPAPSVFYNTVLKPSDGSNNLAISFSSGASFSSSNYDFELSFDSYGHTQRFTFGSRNLTLTKSNNYYIRPTGYNVSTVFYILCLGTDVWVDIQDISSTGIIRNHYVQSVLANYYDTKNGSFTLQNSYGINQFPYKSDGSDNTPVSLSIIPVVCSLYNYIDSISVYAADNETVSIIGLFYSHNPLYDENTAYEEGFQEGKEEGFALGKQEGISIGDQQGYDRGLEEGKEIGYQEGLVADEPLTAFQALLVGANQALQTPLFGEGDGAFSIMDFVVIALGLGLLFWFLKMFAGG